MLDQWWFIGVSEVPTVDFPVDFSFIDFPCVRDFFWPGILTYSEFSSEVFFFFWQFFRRSLCFAYLRKTPPSKLALRHSGGDNRLCTSATVTLYLLVLLSNDSLPGTEQNTSDGCVLPDNIDLSPRSDCFISATRKYKFNLASMHRCIFQ